MRFRRTGEGTMTVDLHGMYLADAQELLLNWLDHAAPEITELRVIHGSNQGTVLKELVRSGLKHHRIAAVLPTLNPGETRVLLKRR